MNNVIKTAAMEAAAEAREEGKKEGIEIGKHSEKLEIARNLLDVLDDATIAAKTGLSIEAIKGLR
ncbi:MAG: hypothetical protein IE928_06765 [Gammaproteobacteria bacterium]|nr:hypothetical protein [Gammaproteobacteria bacterium]